MTQPLDADIHACDISLPRGALGGPTGTKATYAQLGAERTISSLKLSNEDGRERVIEP